MKITKIMLLLNVFFVLAFLGLRERSVWLSRIDVAARYVYLDRGDVINHDALKALVPELAGNDRCDVPRWLAESPLRCERQNAVLGCLLAVANAVFVAFLGGYISRMRRTSTQQRAKGADGLVKN